MDITSDYLVKQNIRYICTKNPGVMIWTLCHEILLPWLIPLVKLFNAEACCLIRVKVR